ncbi:MAG: hypothetical protein WA970_20250, partial [Gammaproteobacteria bacterium]
MEGQERVIAVLFKHYIKDYFGSMTCPLPVTRISHLEGGFQEAAPNGVPASTAAALELHAHPPDNTSRPLFERTTHVALEPWPTTGVEQDEEAIMDLSEMLGLSLKQGLLLVGSGLVLAAVIAAWALFSENARGAAAWPSARRPLTVARGITSSSSGSGAGLVSLSGSSGPLVRSFATGEFGGPEYLDVAENAFHHCLHHDLSLFASGERGIAPHTRGRIGTSSVLPAGERRTRRVGSVVANRKAHVHAAPVDVEHHRRLDLVGVR